MRCGLGDFSDIEGLDMRICWGFCDENFSQRDTTAVNGARGLDFCSIRRDPDRALDYLSVLGLYCVAKDTIAEDERRSSVGLLRERSWGYSRRGLGERGGQGRPLQPRLHQPYSVPQR